MINTVENFIIKYNLQNSKILIGLSGGVDSVSLCEILSRLKNKYNLDITAIHLNHNWRGEESKKDEEFSKKFALDRELGFFSKTLGDDVKKNETEAREQRYKFFEDCKNQFGAKAVFLAHNKNDNVETLLYRLIKGTGPRGLLSIPEVRDFYFRPLISIERYKIEAFAKENNLPYIIDSSNKNIKYKRNLIREEILPLMREINPNAINSISNFILVNKMNQNIVDKVIANCSINKRGEFLTYDREIQFELINRLIENKVKNRDYKTVKKIVDFIYENTSAKISLGKNLFLKIYNDEIYLYSKEKKDKTFEIDLKSGKNIFNDYVIELKCVEIPEKFEQNTYLKLDLNKNFKIRTRKEKDIIVPFGGKTPQKLKDFFIKKKIKEELRSEIPLIALDCEIFYISNIAQSEKTRIDKNDEKCYKISIKRKL